jgi:hypothetical protein
MGNVGHNHRGDIMQRLMYATTFAAILMSGSAVSAQTALPLSEILTMVEVEGVRTVYCADATLRGWEVVSCEGRSRICREDLFGANTGAVRQSPRNTAQSASTTTLEIGGRGARKAALGQENHMSKMRRLTNGVAAEMAAIPSTRPQIQPRAPSTVKPLILMAPVHISG